MNRAQLRTTNEKQRCFFKTTSLRASKIFASLESFNKSPHNTGGTSMWTVGTYKWEWNWGCVFSKLVGLNFQQFELESPQKFFWTPTIQWFTCSKGPWQGCLNQGIEHVELLLIAPWGKNETTFPYVPHRPISIINTVWVIISNF